VGLKLARELVSSICVSFSLLTQFPAEGSFRPGALHAGPEFRRQLFGLLDTGLAALACAEN
jgi:hypothetical protein